MKIVFLLIGLYIIIKSIGYGIYEWKQENNKIGSIVVSTLALIAAVGMNVILWVFY